MTTPDIDLGTGLIGFLFATVGVFLKRTIDRQDVQQREIADARAETEAVRSELKEIRVALIGIDGKNGLRSVVTEIKQTITDLAERVPAPATPRRRR